MATTYKYTLTFRVACFALYVLIIAGNPSSKPYIPFRTDPFDQPVVDHAVQFDDQSVEHYRSRVTLHDSMPNTHCPLQLTLGISKRMHGGDGDSLAIHSAPVIYPVFPSRGPGRQVIYNTRYEHLDLLTPAPTSGKNIKEALIQGYDFPLLMESSAFLTSPILHDVNGDGKMDAILTDYDGGIYFVGLSTSHDGSRFFKSAQVPRIYLRREWLERRVNESLGIQPVKPENISDHEHAVDDPYHSYFEFYPSPSETNKDILRGVTANLLRQDAAQMQALQQRKSRRVNSQSVVNHDGQLVNDQESNLIEPLFNESNEVKQDVKDDDAIDDLAWAQAMEHKRELYGEEEYQGVDQDNVAHQVTDEQRQAEEHVAAENSKEVVEDHRRLQEISEEAHEYRERESDPAGVGDHQSISNVDVQAEEDRMQQQQVVENENVVDADEEESKTLHDAVQEKVESVDQHLESREEPQVREQGGLYDDPVPDIDSPRDRGYDDYGMDDPNPHRHNENVDTSHDDIDPAYDDYAKYGRGRHAYDYDDAYRFHNTAHQEYYDSKHYIRIAPHILSTPTLAELPKLYTNKDEKDEILFVPVSYYLDEDEFAGYFSYKRFAESDHGDETEVNRGRYVASAILAYVMGDNPHWSGQEHLDLSTDYTAPENATLVGTLPVLEDRTRMGAFALGSPTVADIDGDGKLEILLGTSMGIVYCFDARSFYKKDKWPIQMRHPVESRILVEDVSGDAHLEIIVADIGGNIICFDNEGKRIWHRNLATSLGVSELDVFGTSSMVLGDLNGDGKLDLVSAVTLNSKSTYMFAMDAATGADLNSFPIQLDLLDKPSPSNDLHTKLPQPLIVDLSTDHSFVEEYIRRGGVTKRHILTLEHQEGLHIVFPLGETLYIIEALSGCTHLVSVGETITAPVQADDVHGTNRLDLVVATEKGNIITLESQAPYHPLNVWNNGESRGRLGGNVHGYSATQGIFVHEMSRQYLDVFGVYVHVTFEVFDNRRNVLDEHRKYNVEIRDGPSHKRALFRSQYDRPGVYSERVFVLFGPGYYSFHVILTTSHGLVYEDVFHLGYNVHFMSGFGVLLWLPLISFGLIILACGTRKDLPGLDDQHDRDVPSLGGSSRSQALPSFTH